MDEINSNCITFPYQLYDITTTQQQPAPDPLPVPHGRTIDASINKVKINTGEKQAEISTKAESNKTIQPLHDADNLEPTGPINEAFTLQWFISEGQKCFKRSMVKNPTDYYPAFIQSYRPTFCKFGINEGELINALIL